MPQTTTRTVTSGDLRAVFTHTDDGWQPDWIYEADTPMLRFKDHTWLAIGHLHPATAETVTEAGKGLRFAGTTPYGQTPVAWSVEIQPDTHTGFDITCTLQPATSIELLEAFTTFETPYDYDGRETVLSLIGMNPVCKWIGNQQVTPPVWENPAWVYGRPQAVRMTAPCHTPYLFQAITDATCGIDRYISVIGDWNVSRVHDVHAHPTRDTPQDPPSIFKKTADRKGYKYLVGALNWSGAYAKDPNVLFDGGQPHRQRCLVRASSHLPGESLDAALLDLWQRTALLDIPENGEVNAWFRAAQRGVTWQSATRWLRDVFTKKTRTEDLFDPQAGICTYARGSRPKAGDHYTWSWWTQWAGLFHYRAMMTGDDELADACRRHDERFAEHSEGIDYFRAAGIANKVSSLPAVMWIAGGGKDSLLHATLRPLVESSCQFSISENGKTRSYDYGAQASLAESLLYGYRAYGDTAMKDQALLLLAEMRERLDGNFWEFNVGPTGNTVHGGQIRSLGHGHAVMANLQAHAITGDTAWLHLARRFARYLLAINYATHNGSHDPDFDFRGWCNGSNAGRDQIAEFPPWETQNGLLCCAALMARDTIEDAFYDALWYIGNTGLAQFPAARTLKRILDQKMQVHYIPRDRIASERDFYDRWPYLAYENPHDQTLLASYQGTDCLIGDFVYGGGLASAADPRIAVLVPHAASLDISVAKRRTLHLWNPTPEPVETGLQIHWPDRETNQTVTVPPRRPHLLEVTR